ncbi:hypothetical protein [Candidatus Nitrosarchaeum limnium]|uniref:Uncharacterized protein n=1 Tax=Candidatus Nitrosarchaeum limnium BG20 TaxID=859192 RepID=S2E3C4_9ARCH|nr:hypothetical protein [Candidatus Nitrosarchaeum limnium]EPA05318.1 hypothetical protein BG20_I0116 [Candidatus Nitrosarchaeum limnium BG20]
MREGWMRSRWWEFRMGHSTYLIFILTFVNFVLISYRLLIEKIPFLKEIVPELWIFVVVFLALYIPVSIIIGFWHRRTQLRVETTLSMEQNPFVAKMFRTMLDVQTGKATKEEIEKFREVLVKIEKKFEFGGI